MEFLRAKRLKGLETHYSEHKTQRVINIDETLVPGTSLKEPLIRSRARDYKGAAHTSNGLSMMEILAHVSKHLIFLRRRYIASRETKQ